MTELPPEMKDFGLGPRTFKRRADDRSGDRSVWTDTPADRERKAKVTGFFCFFFFFLFFVQVYCRVWLELAKIEDEIIGGYWWCRVLRATGQLYITQGLGWLWVRRPTLVRIENTRTGGIMRDGSRLYSGGLQRCEKLRKGKKLKKTGTLESGRSVQELLSGFKGLWQRLGRAWVIAVRLVSSLGCHEGNG